MKWNIEELVEDVIVSYLTAGVSGELNVYAAWNFEDIEYPCAVVHAGLAGPVSDPAEWNDARMMTVQCAVMTEAAPETDGSGTVVLTIRERNIKARSKVLNLLCVSDLVTHLNALVDGTIITGLALSMAQLTTTERTVEDGKLVTTINMEVIAEPVTGS